MCEWRKWGFTFTCSLLEIWSIVWQHCKEGFFKLDTPLTKGLSLVSQLDGGLHEQYLAYEWTIVQVVTWHCQRFWSISWLFFTPELSSVPAYLVAKSFFLPFSIISIPGIRASERAHTRASSLDPSLSSSKECCFSVSVAAAISYHNEVDQMPQTLYNYASFFLLLARPNLE